MFQIDIARI